MQQKEIDRNELVEHKKRLEKHKKAIESNEMNTQKKEATIKKKATKKAFKEKQQVAAKKAMEKALKGDIDTEESTIEEEPKESQVVITKEERAERFKRLHAMVQDMMKKQNE